MTAPSKTTEAARAATPSPAAKPAAPAVYYVLDTTAVPDTQDSAGKTVTGTRTHEMLVDGIVKSFKFEHGKPLLLPREVALKFLNIEAFKCVDAEGNPKPFRRPPRQPHELGAGEQFKLGDDETVARYDELSTPALQHRVVAMPGGERFVANPSRTDMIAFIVAARQVAAKQNLAKAPDVGRDEFVPLPDLDEAA